MFFNSYREADDPLKCSALATSIIDFVKRETGETIKLEDINWEVCTPEFSMYSVMIMNDDFIGIGIEKRGDRLTKMDI